MPIDKNRRKRKRRPTVTPRFGASTVALEIGLVRLALEAEREFRENAVDKDKQ